MPGKHSDAQRVLQRISATAATTVVAFADHVISGQVDLKLPIITVTQFADGTVARAITIDGDLVDVDMLVGEIADLVALPKLTGAGHG